MLAELVEYLLTPCPRYARKLGYLAEAVAIRARHRRCRAAWQSHLDNTRAAILDAASSSPGRRCAMILGSGALLDIPVGQLADMFERVVLADVVHPLAARWRVRRLSNVCLETVDVSGVLETLAREACIPKTPARENAGPSPGASGAPEVLAALIREHSPDLLVSANILSQLPLLPLRRLKAAGDLSQPELDAFAAGIMAAHIAALADCPGTACLITDTGWRESGRREASLRGAELPPPERAWTWNIAPRPEVHRDRDIVHEVGVFLLGQRGKRAT